MSVDRRRVVSELPLPLAPGAGILDALAIAVAIEDACAVRLPDELLTPDHLRSRESIESVLRSLAEPD